MLEFTEPEYADTVYQADDVEALRQEQRARQQETLEGFRTLERDYKALSSDLATQMGDEEEWARRLERLANGPTLGDRVSDAFARLAGKRRRPLSEQLELQLEAVQTKVHSVARLRESIDGHVAALEEDIRRLNRDVISAAKNEELAAIHVLELNGALDELEAKLLAWDVDQRESPEFREAEAEADELRAQIRLHGSRARAFGHAEDRLAQVVQMNRHFLEMLRHTAENMEQLTGAANQVVDEISGNIQALTQLTLANEMAVDLMQASRALKDGINKVATVASETSLELTRDVDRFVTDMRVYDESTLETVEKNLSEERRLRQEQVDAAIAHAYEKAGATEAAGT